MTASLLRLARPALVDGTWTSSWLRPPHPIRELVPSWCATVPDGSFLRVEAQALVGERETVWYTICRWSEGDRRTSTPRARDRDAQAVVDTLVASNGSFGAARLRVTLEGEGEVASVSASLWDGSAGASRPQGAEAEELDVPPFSQQLYAGRHPGLGGGGEAWCSPTSVAMVLAYHGIEIPDDPVVAAARGTYDTAYRGCGNWGFSTAYAARHGLDSAVARLPSLTVASQWISSGVPLVLSIKAAAGALDGFPIASGTKGHLLVLRGFTDRGDPIVNEPAADDIASVRRIYPSDQLERCWLDGSGGIVYLIAPKLPIVTM